jgi:hypothetical protein
MANQPTSDGMWQVQLQNKFSLLSSAEASPSVQSRSDPEQSKSIKGSVIKNNEPDSAKSIRVASLNINRGLIKKENELKYTIQENNIDIIGVSEVDLMDFDEKKPFKIEGFNTFFPLKRPGSNKKRLLCFVKDNLDITQRSDLMSNTISSVWLELKTKSQKILICTIYREWDNLDGNGPLDTGQHTENLRTLQSQIEIAIKEGLVIVIGDMNIDLKKWESQKINKTAEDYQLLIGECGLEILDFGFTWSRIIESVLKQSAIDHALINKPEAVKDYFKVKFHKSDHDLIGVEVKINVQKIHRKSTTTRDYRKVRNNPQFLLRRLNKINWNALDNMTLNDMVIFYTEEINMCLDECAPWKTKRVKKKKYVLSKEILELMRIRNKLHNELQKSVKNGTKNNLLETQYKKHNNYCNKMIRKEVKQKNGENITSDSNMKDIWKCIKIVQNPEATSIRKLKIEIDGQKIEDPQKLANEFSEFFVEKVQKLEAGIKRTNIDPLSLLKEKMKTSNTTFTIKTVNVRVVHKILKDLKAKRSYGHDGITSEVLKLGADVLKVPLTFIVNTSIRNSEYPSYWKIAKMIALYKKGNRLEIKNYRPVSLLCVAGMVLERVIAIQIEEYFESNNLLGAFQFGFRKYKSTISELLTLFDSLLEGKENRKEIMIILYDLSAAFDTVSHDILLEKLKAYGFDDSSLKWMKSYLQDRQQYVQVDGKISEIKVTNIGTPQGSRLSPILFLCLMADMDLWIKDSKISNFADDTQSIIIKNTKEEAIETTKVESKNIIDFFSSNNFVNNANKAALIYNSKGKGSEISVDIGGEKLSSTYTEKLLGLHINADLKWNTHIDEISSELKKRIGILKRIKEKVPADKLSIMADAIFNSVIRYGIAVYLVPTYEKEDLKARKLSSETYDLQVLQNNMLRVIHGLRISNRVNMVELRTRMKMMSVNQMSIYHTIMEVFNIIHNKSSEQISNKYSHHERHSLRKNTNNYLRVPEKHEHRKCTGFTYCGAKVFNSLPIKTRETKDRNIFKTLVKKWIWDEVTPY